MVHVFVTLLTIYVFLFVFRPFTFNVIFHMLGFMSHFIMFTILPLSYITLITLSDLLLSHWSVLSSLTNCGSFHMHLFV